MTSKAKRKVAYFYDTEVGSYYMGPGHPMKPHRIRLVHNLVLHYGLHNQMEVYRPRLAETEDMTQFHTDEYIDFLKNITPDSQDLYVKQAKLFSMNKDDCPIFTGLFEYCQRYTGGSIGGAVKLNHSSSDVVINWAGGLHHAKKSEASGFCYVNDIVLAILELLKYHQRVLYVDIDVHHGDGVEEAFLHSDRVMTVSFHKHGGDFFPGTGDISSMGVDEGYGYSMNVPLRNGMTDSAYWALFKPVMAKVMQIYQPEAIVFQSGADSLAGDMLGVFNLSIKGHAECLMFMESFNVPMMVLGGGGYTINNVARCWAYETGCILGDDLADEIPGTEYREYFAPEYRLHINPNKATDNSNSPEHLEKLRNRLLNALSKIKPAPSVPFHARVPDSIQHSNLEILASGHGSAERPQSNNIQGGIQRSPIAIADL